VDEEVLAEIAAEMRIRRTEEVFLLFGMGSQFDHLIKMALTRIGVFCLAADPASITAADVRRLNPKGIIVSGGPASVRSEPPPFDVAIFDLGIPVLGICLGLQMWANYRGLEVSGAKRAEYGVHQLHLLGHSELFTNISSPINVVQSHFDQVKPGGGVKVLALTDNAPVAAARLKHLWGVQFHPEVSHTEQGDQIFENFCFGICGAQDRFPAEAVAEQKIAELRQQIAGSKVAIALSGGKDSSICAYLVGEAIDYQPGRVLGIYIKGVDRADDEAHVLEYFGSLPWLELKIVDARAEYLASLQGKTTWAEKRNAMRTVYKPILENAAVDFGADFLVQGTLYTDITESGEGMETGARKARIKRHHNVGLKFTEVVELTPLATEVKDSGIAIGEAIGVPEAILTSQPFPGPGLIVRVEDEVTEEKLVLARTADQWWHCGR
jgi:GMP synthase (glutamine-hydrolysing)